MLLLNCMMSFITVRLLDFNTSYVVIKLIINFTRFRCRLISIHLMLLLNLMLAWQMLVFKHFNTSYVVIKHKYIKFKPRSHTYFNTSYVVIKRLKNISNSLADKISIHLMLLLNC